MIDLGLALVSFDAVSSRDVDYLATLTHFPRLMARGTLVTEVSSVFLSNTYPVHCSVVTGMLPGRHGVVENLFHHPDPALRTWRCRRENIRTTTLYDEAKKRGRETCAILWPVTAGARIRHNLPEVLPERGEHQVVASLKAGSVLFQLRMLLRYAGRLRGIRQPELDDFATSCALDAAQRKRFDLLLLHFTDVDYQKHHYGPDSAEARDALRRLDDRLGALMAAYDGWDFVVFGDHGCRPVRECVDIGRFWPEGTSFWHPAGGCAFLRVTGGDVAAAREQAAALVEHPACHIKRILSDEEMAEAGLDAEFALGVEAEDGFCFAVTPHRGNHGYSLAQEDYKVFYLASGREIYRDKRTRGGRVTDIAPLCAALLDVPLWEMDGRLNQEVFYGQV